MPSQVELNLLEAEAQFGVSMDGLEVSSFELSPGQAVEDMYIVMGHSGQRIAGRLEYNSELFSPARAARIAAGWQVGSPVPREGSWAAVPAHEELSWCRHQPSFTIGSCVRCMVGS